MQQHTSQPSPLGPLHTWCLPAQYYVASSGQLLLTERWLHTCRHQYWISNSSRYPQQVQSHDLQARACKNACAAAQSACADMFQEDPSLANKLGPAPANCILLSALVKHTLRQEPRTLTAAANCQNRPTCAEHLEYLCSCTTTPAADAATWRTHHRAFLPSSASHYAHACQHRKRLRDLTGKSALQPQLPAASWARQSGSGLSTVQS